MPVVGELLAGRFRLESVLGNGSSGAVFAASDEVLGTRVAVKVFHAHLLDSLEPARLRREVQAARRAHRNLVAVYDLHHQGPQPFLSMELVEGGTLRSVLAEHGRLPATKVADIGRQLAAALAHLHEEGLVHRDVKPGNVLLADGGTVKLCDLGLVRSLAHGGTVTESAMVVGTPSYMAPEQALPSDLTPAADVYALGITLYEALTATVPLVGDSAVATLMRRQRGRVPRLRRVVPDCPRLLDRLLARMLDPSPQGRPSAAEVEHSLATGRLRFRPPWRALAATVLVVTLALGGWLGCRALRRGATASVEATGSSVQGLDDRGQTTWRYTLASQIRQVEHADLDGDGTDETLVAAWPEDREGIRTADLPRSEFLAVRQDGTVVTTVRPEDLVTLWHHPFPKRLRPKIQVIDVDGDDIPEVLLACEQRAFYPDQLLLFWPRWQVWDWVLDHAGWIYSIVAVPGSDPPAIRFVAINNLLGVTGVLGEIAILPPPQRRGDLGPARTLSSPPANNLLASVFRWQGYLPFQATSGYLSTAETLSVAADGSTLIEAAGWQLTVDPLWNPVPGPNAGLDLRAQRRSFFFSLARLQPALLPSSVDDRRALIERLRADLARLLREPAYRVPFDLTAAHALAEAGNLAGAIAVLSDTNDATAVDIVTLRLAELEALAGRLDEAGRHLEHLTETSSSAKAAFDGPQLWLRVAIDRHDPSELAAALGVFRRRFSAEPDRLSFLAAAALEAQARVWWDEPTDLDCEVQSWPYAPQGEAIACLARWRMGRTLPADVERMQASIADNPDAVWESRLALGAALLAEGRTAEAVGSLRSTTSTLEPFARTNFALKQVLVLAQAVLATAMAEDGDGEQAGVIAAGVLQHGEPRSLAAALSREVLASRSPGLRR